MRRLSILCAAAGIGLTALAASPVEAAYHVIRWDNTGFCQVWNPSNPPTQWPSKYVAVSKRIPTFPEAMAAKDSLVHKGTCKF
jgi:hypothetical protein